MFDTSENFSDMCVEREKYRSQNYYYYFLRVNVWQVRIFWRCKSITAIKIFQRRTSCHVKKFYDVAVMLGQEIYWRCKIVTSKNFLTWQLCQVVTSQPVRPMVWVWPGSHRLQVFFLAWVLSSTRFFLFFPNLVWLFYFYFFIFFLNWWCFTW